MRYLLGRPSPALIVAVIALVAATGGWALAAIPARDGTVTACYAKSGGALRVVDAKKKCTKTEKRLTFNQKGQDGRDGVNGQNGTNGKDGVNGTDATIPPVEGRHVVGQPGQPGFQSTWTTSIGFPAPSFWKDRDGVVHLEGDTFYGPPGTNPAFSTIYTLPAGYRPSGELRFMVPTATEGTLTTLRVSPSGAVRPEQANINGGSLTMDGVTFRAEQ
jgi:hypothetical protein